MIITCKNISVQQKNADQLWGNTTSLGLDVPAVYPTSIREGTFNQRMGPGIR